MWGVAQWARKGGHSTLAMIGPLNLVTGVFLRIIWPKNEIKAVSKALKQQENYFLAYFRLSRQQKKSAQS